VDCIHGPIDIDGAGAEVEGLRAEGKLEGLQLFINPDECIECDACVPACPPDAVYEDEYTCIDYEGNDESVKKNYEFFDQEWNG
jgi:NAD-dependent dihydropyrimidine dehydrogenase PreA subunit